MPITTLPKARHQWAPTGVSGYPLAHPIVGQTRFFDTFERFIHLVDAEHEKFAHVFAIAAPWGVGKSRLGYELIAQINDSSRGWYVRNDAGTLYKAELFRSEDDREQYLGLYLRYSQIFDEHQNADNWFGYGLYKALLPLARGIFDGSIQHEIAREASNRLEAKGFDPAKLAAALEVDRHSNRDLYLDEYLVTRLCLAAYEYLKTFGINYVLIALDELETATEAATYGLEVADIKQLDGRAIKLIGKAIKEEDPKRKLPFLRYVALCSPAVGDELREIRSTARRFEMVELSANTFSDVSDFVRTLKDQGRLDVEYPPGLVEAAYAMSAGNFGWFNVVMANVDELLSKTYPKGTHKPETVGEIFTEALRGSSRIREHVLDAQAIQELVLDRKYLPQARELLYGELPVPLESRPDDVRQALLAARNEYDEPVTTLFRRVEWEDQAISQALRAAKFERDKQVWKLSGVEEPVDLRQLLNNLSTYALHAGATVQAADRHVLLLPLRQPDFVELVAMLYPHPAAEDVARALWRTLVGDEEFEASRATHFGPSIAMLGRLNLRYRRQTQNALIFRDPDQNATHERAVAKVKAQTAEERARQVLTGVMRALDAHWDYEAVGAGLRGDVPAVVTAAGRGRGDKGGLQTCDALKLHPKGRLVLAWVRSYAELKQLVEQVAQQIPDEGLTPVLAFTSSLGVIDQYKDAADQSVRGAQRFLMLYHLSATEEFAFHQIGLPQNALGGVRMTPQLFTTAFAKRLLSIERPLRDAVHDWRRELNQQGRIAWPLRPGGPLKANEREVLFKAWHHLMLGRSEPRSLSALDETSGVKIDEVRTTLAKMANTQKAARGGYAPDERAGLFDRLDDQAEPRFPPFLLRLIEGLLDGSDHRWTLGKAEEQWFWGYLWEGAAGKKDVYEDWLALACDIGFAAREPEVGKAEPGYRLVTTADLGGYLKAATNWFEQTLPGRVALMEDVFGERKVRGYFDPREGTQTRAARKLLADAGQELESLKLREDNRRPEQSVMERAGVVAACARLRTDVDQKVRLVYDQDGFGRLGGVEEVTALSFEDRGMPLWQKVGLAERFAKFVLHVKKQILGRIKTLRQEMEAQVKPLPGFPLQLFVRSLEKVGNILSGAVGVGRKDGSTQRIQAQEADTLGYYLQDLDIAQAREKLRRLAVEVGVSFSGPETPLAQIDAPIAKGFRDLVAAYGQERTDLATLEERIAALDRLLADAPAGWTYPTTVPPIPELRRHAEHVRGELEESLAEDAEGLLAEHDRPARTANFTPLIQAAQNLVHGPRMALARLGGQVLTLENTVAGYRRGLLGHPDLRETESALNALLRARGESARAPLGLPDIEKAGPLLAADKLVAERRTEWVQAGENLLAETGVSFREWREVVRRVETGCEPDLKPDSLNRLVERGYLRRIYTLGGPHA